MSLRWNRLLSRKRLGAARDASPAGIRTDFQRDFDRIVFSSAFRRLQDKTQVFPLGRNDYVRTRLTHSLEVASVGRSLGVLAGRYVLEGHPELSASPSLATISFELKSPATAKINAEGW